MLSVSPVKVKMGLLGSAKQLGNVSQAYNFSNLTPMGSEECISARTFPSVLGPHGTRKEHDEEKASNRPHRFAPFCCGFLRQQADSTISAFQELRAKQEMLRERRYENEIGARSFVIIQKSFIRREVSRPISSLGRVRGFKEERETQAEGERVKGEELGGKAPPSTVRFT